MPQSELHFKWEWDLRSPPEALWLFISDSNRFNYDRGNAPLKRVNPNRLANAQQLIRLGDLEYEEAPFEWVRPYRWGVDRMFKGGLFDHMRLLFELEPRDGGTHLISHTWLTPTNALGKFILPIVLERSFRPAYDKAIREYDRVARLPVPAQFGLTARRVEFAPGGRDRLEQRKVDLQVRGAKPELIEKLVELIEAGDEVALARMRPYALADFWGVPRREVLELCLQATRAGLLEFHWEVLCPLCRGVKESASTLGDLKTQIHCDSCNIDSTANFDRSVEITFNPSPDIRPRQVGEFCVGSPQLTPHIVAQQLLKPKEKRTLTVPLEAGRYRLRALEMPGGQALLVTPDGQAELAIAATTQGWQDDELRLSLQPTLNLGNDTSQDQLLILERTAWSDAAVTAAEVTALQMFRDLFSNEALRPGEQIRVGSITLLFTDLRNSTRMYRDVGDAVAFGRVMNHFDTLKHAVAIEQGGLVKTIGDAIMGVFIRPVHAVRAILVAQHDLAFPPEGVPPLQLKGGIHFGPCIAVNLNDRLDYFGSTVNLAARLEGLSAAGGIVISDVVYKDPEVQAYFKEMHDVLTIEPFTAQIKGFDQETFELWRVVWKSK